MKNHIINFYAGIISVSLYIYLFYDSGLYAESLLNVYYLIMSIGGIFLWQKKSNSEAMQITTLDQSGAIKTVLLCLILFVLLFFILKNYTDSTVPYADAFVSAAAWTGCLLLLYRKIENWIWLNISNAVAIPLLIYKGLELTSVLTMVYFVIAILGYLKWKKLIRLNES